MKTLSITLIQWWFNGCWLLLKIILSWSFRGIKPNAFNKIFRSIKIYHLYMIFYFESTFILNSLAFVFETNDSFNFDFNSCVMHLFRWLFVPSFIINTQLMQCHHEINLTKKSQQQHKQIINYFIMGSWTLLTIKFKGIISNFCRVYRIDWEEWNYYRNAQWKWEPLRRECIHSRKKTISQRENLPPSSVLIYALLMWFEFGRVEIRSVQWFLTIFSQGLGKDRLKFSLCIFLVLFFSYFSRALMNSHVCDVFAI